MSRILQPRRAKTTQSRDAHIITIPTTNYEELKLTKDGERVLDLSKDASFTTVDRSVIQKIQDLNTDTSGKENGEVVYDDVLSPYSNYKHRMIQNMVSELRQDTQYLYERDPDEDDEYISYEDQIERNAAAATTSIARQKRIMAEMHQTAHGAQKGRQQVFDEDDEQADGPVVKRRNVRKNGKKLTKNDVFQ